MDIISSSLEILATLIDNDQCVDVIFCRRGYLQYYLVPTSLLILYLRRRDPLISVNYRVDVTSS